jgi:hypothetical protein
MKEKKDAFKLNWCDCQMISDRIAAASIGTSVQTIFFAKLRVSPLHRNDHVTW